jgi:hypothetical protein
MGKEQHMTANSPAVGCSIGIDVAKVGDDSLDAATTGTESSIRSAESPAIRVKALADSFLNSL